MENKNCERIIADSKENKENKEDKNNKLLGKYIHDIRNSKKLSKEILANINNMSYEDRFEILMVYNDMISYYVSIFE